MISGALWMTLLRLADRTIGTISTLILVRLLSPSDFGIVAMSNVFVLGLEMLTAFGFQVVLIQKQDATRVHYDTAWTFRVVFGIISSTLLLVASPYIAEFYGKPELVHVVQVLAAGFLIRSLENIALVDFQKHLQFSKEFVLRLTVKLIGFSVTIPLAFVYQNYWALVIGVVSTNFAAVFLGYLMKPYLPRLTFAARRELFSFSAWLLLNNFIFYARDRLPDLFLGRVLGARALGLYSISMEISTVATSEVGTAVNRAVFPGYASMSKNADELKRSIVGVTGTMAAITLPLGFGLMSLAERIIPTLLGDQWQEAGGVIVWLCVFGVVAATTSNWFYVFNALAKPFLASRVGIFQVVLLLPLMYLLLDSYGLSGVAGALAFVAVATIPYMLRLLRTHTGLRSMDMGRVVIRPLAAALTMAGGVALASSAIPTQNMAYEIPLLLSLVALGAVVYGAVLFLLWHVSGRPMSAEYYLYEFIKNRFSSRAAPS
jgi:lipopolysaccharide exporter